jgi:hypothetical protein
MAIMAKNEARGLRVTRFDGLPAMLTLGNSIDNPNKSLK